MFEELEKKLLEGLPEVIYKESGEYGAIRLIEAKTLHVCRKSIKSVMSRVVVDEDKLADVIQLRYFKLMSPLMTEDNAKTVARALATAIAKADVIKLREG